ncbi:hypothetical protein OK074_2343 [Actinobacteria bacterium OK074]|nr:hypothetical protein OK074_2343 [Actinobacteria bacterium OK074]
MPRAIRPRPGDSTARFPSVTVRSWAPSRSGGPLPVHSERTQLASERKEERAGRRPGRRDGGIIVHDEFLCHVTAYGICGGQRVGVPLGTYRAPTLALALWWMRDRALWIAERLDPDPDSPLFPPNSVAPVSATVPDVPRLLRTWCGDVVQQDLVADELAAGRLVRVATNDDTTEYELLAESVDALRMQRFTSNLSAPAA